jgi:ATP-dependent Clp protease ATP-binding subunit ClpC
MKGKIMGELKKTFRPEFLNRIDEVIVFHKLEKEEIFEIVDLLLRRIRESMAERELSLNLTNEAKELLVDKGWDPAMGARPLRRAIQRFIEDPLADEVLKQSMEPGSTIEVDRAPEGVEPEVKIDIVAPKKKRVPAGVGAKGEMEAGSEGSSEEGEGAAPSGGSDLPDDPEVLPEVPDAPPEQHKDESGD